MNTTRFVEVLNSQVFGPLIGMLIVIFVILDIAVIVMFVYSIKRSMHYRPDFDLGIKKAQHMLSLRERLVVERWNSVVARIVINSPEAAKLAIIEADNLVNDVLKELKIPGDDLVDRLSNLELEDLEHDEEVFAAHRLKKDLITAPGFVVSIEDGKKAVAAYEAFLKELGLLGEPPAQGQQESSESSH